MLRLADGRRASMKEAAVRSVRRMWLSPTDMSDGRCASGIGRGPSSAAWRSRGGRGLCTRQKKVFLRKVAAEDGARKQ